MKKRIGIILLLLVLGGGGYYFWLDQQARAISDTVVLYGNIDLRTVALSFTEQEKITSILVDEGVQVEKKELLASLDDRKLQASLLEAKAMMEAQKEQVRLLQTGTRPQEIDKIEAELAAAKTRVANAERFAARLLTTVKTGASTVQDLDNAQAELDVSRAELRVVHESLDLALEGFRSEEIAEAEAVLRAKIAKVVLLEKRLADTRLYAPSAGVIESRVMEPGEMAMPGKTVFSLALTSPKWVRAYLPEPDLGFIAPGMTAQVYTDSFPEKAFTGRVGFVSSTAEFTPKFIQTTELRTQLVYETRIWLNDPDNVLRLGMPVTVAVAAGQTSIKEQGKSQ